MKEEKTQVMRYLDANKTEYESFNYSDSGVISGTEVADYLKIPYSLCYKTLVTVGKSGKHYVFDIPVDKELDLKKAAAAVGEKNVEMVKSKDLLGLTGYIHGGCSPLKMKKFFTTTFDVSAKDLNEICFSGGKIGWFIKVKIHDLEGLIPFTYKDITVEK